MKSAVWRMVSFIIIFSLLWSGKAALHTNQKSNRATDASLTQCDCSMNDESILGRVSRWCHLISNTQSNYTLLRGFQSTYFKWGGGVISPLPPGPQQGHLTNSGFDIICSPSGLRTSMSLTEFDHWKDMKVLYKCIFTYKLEDLFKYPDCKSNGNELLHFLSLES